jgi:hypothetical protein
MKNECTYKQQIINQIHQNAPYHKLLRKSAQKSFFGCVAPGIRHNATGAGSRGRVAANILFCCNRSSAVVIPFLL